MSEYSAAESFSERELEVLHLIADGLSNREIGVRLSISLDTVKWHNRQIFAKLDVNNRTHAAARAQELGLLTDEQAANPPSDIHHNLPAQVTSFVGREHEVGAGRRLLNSARLLTLTGPGGIGKTRVALQLAVDVLPGFVDGVYFIPLSAVSATNNVLWAIAEHLGFQFRKIGEPLDQLVGYLEEKQILLVLDNFEHLTASAGILTDILKHAPHIKMLVTSRERLSLYGEVVYSINGMALPEGEQTDELHHSESVQLFVQRAQAVHPGLQVEADDLRQIARICRLVEGMPLGIELAASWVDTLKPAEIADEIEHSLDILASELRDVPASQHSIRAVFERSWNLLSSRQQVAFQNLAVFQGGFTRKSAQAITGVDLHTLHSLVSKSLLRHDPQTGRFEQHEVLRHYAAEELAYSGEADVVQQAHARYFADFMENNWVRMCGAEQKVALQETEADIDNARVAWEYWVVQEDIEQICKFINTFWLIYDIRGAYPAGIELFQHGIDAVARRTTTETEVALGWLLAVQGLYQVVNGYERGGFLQAKAGFDNAKQGVDLLRKHHREDVMVVPLISLIIAGCHFNEAKVIGDASEECFTIARANNDNWGIGKASHFLAMKALDDDRYDDARQLALDALKAFELNLDRWSMSILCIEVLALLETIKRDFDAASDWIQQGLEWAEEIEFTYSIQMAYWQFGYIEVLKENYSEAARYWRKGESIGERIFGLKSIIGFSGSINAGEWGGRKLTGDE